LKGHLFGDIFGRDNLDFQSREIATIAALANIEGVNAQLEAHFNIGFNTGLTEVQMLMIGFCMEINSILDLDKKYFYTIKPRFPQMKIS
jgi:hypothetical protein